MRFNNQKPLVSICVTCFNSGEYIHRIIDSSLNQTYENIEVVVVDDISTDDTEKIMKEYASRDNRVKYFRNIERLFIIKSLLRMLELAKGKFVVWPGADDWLSRDFIEKGVGNFSAHPEAAAVVPKIVSLNEVDRDKFEFSGEFGLIPGIHPREWLPKRIYKGVIATPTLFSLLRREDMISIISYFLKNYCNDQSLPDEFRKFAQRAYGIDHMYLSEILPKYENFVSDDSIRFIKITHAENMTFGSESKNKMSDFLKAGYYDFLYLDRIYMDRFPKLVRRMRVYTGAETLGNALIYFLRSGLRPSFLDIKGSWKIISPYFSNFSAFETILVIITLIPRMIFRYLRFLHRSLIKKHKMEKNKSSAFIEENFLGYDGHFKVRNPH